jgi:hypothetical protein
MPLNFPSTPADQDVYENYIYDATKGVWNKLPESFDTDEVSEGTVNLYFTNQRAIDAVVENIDLNDLADVDTTGVSDGDALVYDTATTSWVPGSVAIDSLNDISDVNTSGVSDKDVLVYDTTTSSWIASDVPIIKNISEQTGSTYTLALADAESFIKANNATGITVTVPKNSAIGFPIKTQIHFVQYNDGKITFSPVDGDVSIRSTPALLTREKWSVATLIKIGTNEWVLTGDLSE